MCQGPCPVTPRQGTGSSRSQRQGPVQEARLSGFCAGYHCQGGPCAGPGQCVPFGWPGHSVGVEHVQLTAEMAVWAAEQLRWANRALGSGPPEGPLSDQKRPRGRDGRMAWPCCWGCPLDGTACAVCLGWAICHRMGSSQLCCVQWKIPCSVCARSGCFITEKVFWWMLNLVSYINIFKSQLIGKLQ